jgi:hypothetical protein
MMAESNEEEAAEERQKEELKKLEIIDAHVAQLSEHFDLVQILVSNHHDNTGSTAIYRGSGNWFGRYGMIRDWYVKAEEDTKISVHSRKDDGEEEAG